MRGRTPATAACKRASADPAAAALLLLAVAAMVATGMYLYWASFSVRFPADILIWAESEFVADIGKLRVGHPLYTAQQNNESFVYTPGAQVLTYLLAALLGRPTSLPTYRTLQLVYTAGAALLAWSCARQLLRLSRAGARARHMWLWTAAAVPMLFLMATNAITNPFVQDLHNDALAQLVNIAAFWVLLRAVAGALRAAPLWMAVVPTLGFCVKQSLAVWLPLYVIAVAGFVPQRSWTRGLGVGALGAALLAVTIGAAHLLWGEPFFYWVFTVLDRHPQSMVRAAQHLLDAWAYLAIGLFGGWVLLRGSDVERLLGPWLTWLCLVLIQAYTSGLAWTRNHLGSGSLLAGIWFVAALMAVWPPPRGRAPSTPWRAGEWLRPLMAVAVIVLLFNGLGMLRPPIPPFSPDAYRYVRDVEREFEGLPAERVLLDVGSWLYLQQHVVMQDRATTIGDRGWGETGDFSALIGRVRARRYAKILVRNYHSGDFWYDHEIWRTSSGIRRALTESYDEVRLIPHVEGARPERYLFQDISVLVPRGSDAAGVEPSSERHG